MLFLKSSIASITTLLKKKIITSSKAHQPGRQNFISNNGKGGKNGCSACAPACEPLPGCHCRDPPVRDVMRIRLLSAFHPRFCGCSSLLPMLAHTQPRRCCRGFLTRTVLVLHQCLGCCWTNQHCVLLHTSSVEAFSHPHSWEVVSDSLHITCFSLWPSGI